MDSEAANFWQQPGGAGYQDNKEQSSGSWGRHKGGKICIIRLGICYISYSFQEDIEVEYKQNTHSLRLAKFISGAGLAMNNVLEEDLARREGEVVEGLPQRDIDFADSITVLRIEEVR